MRARLGAAIGVLLLLNQCVPAVWCKSPPARKAESGDWRLFQAIANGHFIVKISKNAVKAHNTDTGYTIISKAPDWTVSVFRSDKKIIRTVPHSKWVAEGVSAFNERSFVVRPRKTLSKKRRLLFSRTLKAWEYEFPHSGERRFANGNILDMTAFMANPTKAKIIHATRTTLLVSDEISSNPKLAAVLSSLFVVPIGDGVPLTFIIHFDNGFFQRPLITSRVERIRLARDEFKIPSGYKAVKNVQTVTVGHKKEEIDSMIKDLGVGDLFGGK